MLIVDPPERAMHWLALREGDYRPAQRSAPIELGREQLAAQIERP